MFFLIKILNFLIFVAGLISRKMAIERNFMWDFFIYDKSPILDLSGTLHLEIGIWNFRHVGVPMGIPTW